MNGDSANKFISALVKSLQTLCHGYVEFNDGIEIIGHLYLNIDSGASFDYVVKEKVCKNAENSTVFVSKSFQAQGPAEECITRKDKDDEVVPVFEEPSEMSPTAGTSRLQSAITSISNVLSGNQHDVHKARLIDHSSHHSPVQNNGKRKREHNGSYSSLQPPYKYTTLQASSSYFNSPTSSTKQAVDRNHSEHFNNSSHAEFFGGDSNQSSGMGQEDEEDLDLDVTFVKEEYESQRNSGQRGISAGGTSRLSQDPSSNHSNILHDGGTISYPSTNHHQAPQQFASGTAVELGSTSQNFPDPSQVDISQHSSQGPQNPRSDVNLSSRHLDCTLSGMALDFTSQPFNSSNMTGISDTLQLGIKLFGPTFVADVAAGDLSLPLTTLADENSTISEPVNASVFPEMFDVTTVSSSSLKPNQKVLWHDRKDKLRRSILMRKANNSKIRSKPSTKKVTYSENPATPPPSVKSDNTFSESGSLLDPFGLPFKRKRGRPPKILKMLSRSEFLLESSTRDHALSIAGCSLTSENSDRNSIHDIAVSDNLTPSRTLLEGSSKRIRGSYRQYTPADKLKIVDFGIKYGSTAASRKYNIPESTVRSWTKKMDIFLMQMKNEQKSHDVDSLQMLNSKLNEEVKPTSSVKETEEINNVTDEIKQESNIERDQENTYSDEISNSKEKNQEK
ncbi:hypothetical protein Btru_043709 [Bulinus truncatus]|nr:hypothetical protein Btru_043709 [Bulinus truncatus]